MSPYIYIYIVEHNIIVHGVVQISRHKTGGNYIITLSGSYIPPIFGIAKFGLRSAVVPEHISFISGVKYAKTIIVMFVYTNCIETNIKAIRTVP